MIRLRIPGGAITAEQWQALHQVSEEFGTGTLKITTRQTVQLHGILKHEIRPTIQAFNTAKLDSIAACGDVNRNVIASSHPQLSPIHHQVHEYADKISKLLLPKTKAYYEVFIDGEKSMNVLPKPTLCTKTVIYQENSKLLSPFRQATMWICLPMI
jgi:sulfite reductase (NADPH) hemoprotein beta-component